MIRLILPPAPPFRVIVIDGRKITVPAEVTA